jgi:hypothetical protein
MQFAVNGPGKGVTVVSRRRCFKGVDPVLDGYLILVVIDEEADHQGVHGRRCGKANGPTHETLHPCPQIDVLTLGGLCMLLADFVRLGVDRPLVGAPAIGVKTGHAKRFQPCFQLQKDRILPSPKDIDEYCPTVTIDRMP